MPTSEAEPTQSYRVYVERLSNRLASNRRFVERNPDYRSGRPVIYVGSTGRTPDERLEDRLREPRRYNHYVRRFRRRLFEWAYEDLSAFTTREEAEAAERRRAAELRVRGWAVCQG